jgi:probable aminopeptidase NPEPL1
MAGTRILFRSAVQPLQPSQSPLLVIGQLKHIRSVDFSLVQPKFGGIVSKELWSEGLSQLNGSSADSISLYLNAVVLASLPDQVSRHNTPSRSHSIAKILKKHSGSRNVLIVCEREDVYASGCAVGRCFPTYSKKTKNPPTKEDVNVEFLVVEGERTVGLDLEEKERILLQDSCTAIQLTARLLDAPCNEMNTMHFLDEILKVEKELKTFGVTSTVIKGEELRERGFGGVYGVGRAAENPPVLAILSFKPKKPQRTVAWVGKGIVYDTGGLSIKSKTMMPGMKADCGGAAAILGAFSVAVKSGFQDTLHGIFCLAENSVGPLATRPDDIHTLYSGKTVEINNTDAEGRLVLADGVVYASRDLKADVIVDMATLTGAQGIATGQYHASHLTNSEEWEIKTAVAGRSSGDLSFPAVYCPEFQFPEFK